MHQNHLKSNIHINIQWYHKKKKEKKRNSHELKAQYSRAYLWIVIYGHLFCVLHTHAHTHIYKPNQEQMCTYVVALLSQYPWRFEPKAVLEIWKIRALSKGGKQHPKGETKTVSKGLHVGTQPGNPPGGRGNWKNITTEILS